MRIDLHCHTKSIKHGEKKTRNVTKELFKEKIANADVKIVAITNHNIFDFEQYKELKESVKNFCQVWPGIEIDIEGKKNKYHLIVVSNPDNVEIFNDKIQKLFYKTNLENCKLTITEVYNALKDCDVFYIPHLHKSPGISEKDQEELREIVNDDARIFGEPQNYNSLGVFANHNYNVIIGSDVKDWNNYEQCTFSELKLPVDSFSQLYLLSKKDPTVVNTLLNKKQSYELKATPHKSVNLDLRVFEDVNIIFGQKGTGKSEIINSLYDSMIKKGLKCTKYIGSDKETDFKSLLQNSDMIPDISLVGAEDCKEELSNIFSWSEQTPTSFSKYLDWYNTKDNSQNKSRMKITNATTLIEKETPKHNVHKKDYSTICNINSKLNSIEISEYLNNDEAIKIRQLLDLLKSKIKQDYSNDLIDKFSTKLCNFSIDKIKTIADNKSNSVSKPSTTGFKEFALNRIALKKCATYILSNITDKKHFTLEYLGDIDGKGKIYIRKLYRMLCETSKTNEFHLGIRVLKEAKEKLKQIEKNFASNEISALVDDLSTHCDINSIKSTDCFLGRSKHIVTENKIEYSPSNGEKGILMLQKSLNNNADAYFIDEPELGMGNSYINNTVFPQIIKLAKNHKVVVIATHNANIAVRSLPYTSILRTHENGNYKTYVGNPFNDQLININDNNDIKSWTYESLHTLEGGKEAFYERKYIYESNN